MADCCFYLKDGDDSDSQPVNCSNDTREKCACMCVLCKIIAAVCVAREKKGG